MFWMPKAKKKGEENRMKTNKVWKEKKCERIICDVSSDPTRNVTKILQK